MHAFGKRFIGYPGSGAVAILSTLYSIGELLQHLGWGPNWLRWHLSDFGFPFVTVILIRSLYNVSPVGCLILGGSFAFGVELLQATYNAFDPIDVLVNCVAVVIGILIVKRKEYEQKRKC